MEVVTQEDMIEEQLKARKISDPKVLSAMAEIDRTLFVPENMKSRAYEDRPLPIGNEQTISQPYIVAYMAEQLQLNSQDRILEVGSGCGYNAAVLSRLVLQVYSIEIIQWLADLARENLKKAGIANVETRHGDGYAGWATEAPFDAIILTAAPPVIPAPLKDQLRTGGKILAPVGRIDQKLTLWHKKGTEMFEKEVLLPVRFVPMTGKADKGGSHGV